MEGVEESRFVCKLCSKKFTSGKSLGGHMRSHVVSNSGGKKGSKLVDESGSNGQSGYGLRENPKKTWRAYTVVDSGHVERVCKQCGKGFQSLKALCGHMACHSDKDRGLKGDDHSWTRGGAIDRYSDTEDEERRMGFGSLNKCKKVVDESHSSLGNNNNESSSVSEIEVQEDVEVAMCLMLLSKDSGNKIGVDSIVESSDNNSVVLETNSGNKESLNGIHVQDHQDSDSGYFLDEFTKDESDVSVDGLQRQGNPFRDCRKKPVAGIKPIKNKIAHLGIESRKRKHTENPVESRTGYKCPTGVKTIKSNRRSNVSHESRYECGENTLDVSTDQKTPVKVVETSNNRERSNRNSSKKKIKLDRNEGHICPFCDKVFKNGQALGGHKRSHLVESKNNVPSPVLFDLNLPAPEADDDDELSQFVC